MERDLELAFMDARQRLVRVDPLLDMILHFGGENTFQFGLVIVTGGATFRGIPTAPDDLARSLDSDALWYVQVLKALAEAQQDSESAQRLEADTEVVEGQRPFASRLDEKRASTRRVVDYLDGLPDENTVTRFTDFPEELQDDAVRFFQPPAAFTLDSAEVRPNGGEWEAIGSCRILVSHVQAWWTFRLGAPVEAVDLLPKDV